VNPSFVLEDQYSNKIVSGTDEVGCGALAGPVVACSVVLNRQCDFSNYVADSKTLSAKQRNFAYSIIIANSIYSIGMASVQEIDQFNIRNATILACQRSISNLAFIPDICLIDGNMKFKESRYVSIIKGDQYSYSIAAASIVAKVFRDNLMSLLAQDFELYGWDKNKGYGTKSHLEHLQRLGPSFHHRKTFTTKCQ
jgi:ribonuclease HII